jgi:hypothetical protein
MAVVPACVVAALGVHLLKKPEAAKAPSSIEVVAVRPRAVAVLPFDNLGGGMGSARRVCVEPAGSIRELIRCNNVFARQAHAHIGGRRRYLWKAASSVPATSCRSMRAGLHRNVEIWSLSFDRAIDDVCGQRNAARRENSSERQAGTIARYGTRHTWRSSEDDQAQDQDVRPDPAINGRCSALLPWPTWLCQAATDLRNTFNRNSRFELMW